MGRRFLWVAGGICIALLCFAAGFYVAVYRVPPYHMLQRLLTMAPLPDRGVPPTYRLWRDSYRQVSDGAIVMLGDSITRFGDWPKLFGRDDIVNLGIPGDTTHGILQRLDDGNIPEGSTIFLLAGVNDLIRPFPVQDAVANLKHVVERLGPRHRVYLQSTIYTDQPGLNADIRTMIAGQRAICAAGGCTFVDINAILAPEGTLKPEYSLDGIHLTGAGYRAWAKLLRPHLSRREAAR